MFRTRGLALGDPVDASVWSVVCVCVTRSARGAGVADTLVRAAVDFTAGHGASSVEGYPVAQPDVRNKALLSSGTVGLFQRAGFALDDPTATGRRDGLRLDLPARL